MGFIAGFTFGFIVAGFLYLYLTRHSAQRHGYRPIATGANAPPNVPHMPSSVRPPRNPT